MKNWRVTKYNPDFRDDNGTFQKDEWTSFGDIGKLFGGMPLTLNDYEDMENRYIAAAMHFVKTAYVNKLIVVDADQDCGDIILTDGIFVHMHNLKDVIRLILREEAWCKLECRPNFYLHFGYDYYMYIGSQTDLPDSVEFATSIGLFVEDCVSPYLQ